MTPSASRLLTFAGATKLAVWAAALWGALRVTRLPGYWGHSICGLWGCGPPLQAIVGWHLAWVVVLAPLALGWGPLHSLPGYRLRRFGMALAIGGAALIVGVAIHERISWWPAVSPLQQSYYWQRVGFVIATNVDLPMLQLVVFGLIIDLRGRFVEAGPAPASHGWNADAPVG